MRLNLNERGDVVGRHRFRDEDGFLLPFHGFLFKDGEYTSIDVDLPGVVATLAYGINNRGAISGRYIDGPDGNVPHGFVLRRGKLTTFDFPGASRTFLFGINNRGDTVGAYDENFVGGLDGTMHSFLWRSSGGSDKSSKKDSGKSSGKSSK